MIGDHETARVPGAFTIVAPTLSDVAPSSGVKP
jgi:hypothetical protein